MSKQLVTVVAGLATTTGVGSQYISSVGEVTTSLNNSGSFTSEEDSNLFHDAFVGSSPTTFLNMGIEDSSSFVSEDFSGFESASGFGTVEEVKTPVVEAAPKATEVPVKVPEVTVAPEKVVEPKVEKTVTAPVVKKEVKKPAVKPAAPKPQKPKVVVENEGMFKTQINFKFNGWDNYGMSNTPTWYDGWSWYVSKFEDTKNFTDNLGGWFRTVGRMVVKCNKSSNGFRCWNPKTKKAFDLKSTR